MFRSNRKSLASLATLVVLALLATTCGPATATAPTTAPQATATEAAVSTLPPTQSGAAVKKEKLKIAVAHVGAMSDEGWTLGHHLAIEAVKKAFPDQVEVIAEVESVPWSDEGTRILEQFVADGAQMVFVTSEYADILYKVADAHPNVIFLECNGHRPSANLVTYYFQTRFVYYLKGQAAGLLTKTNNIGFVGSFADLPSNVNAFNAVEMGALSVNPKAVTHVVNVNTWFDPALERQAAEALMANGADVLTGYMDDPSVLQAAEEKGNWSFGYNLDLRKYAPKWYVTGDIINWGPSYIKEVQSVLDGTWKGSRFYNIPLGPDGFYLDKWGPNVPQDVQAKVDATENRILNEGYDPFVGPIYDATGTLRIKQGDVLTEDFFYTQWTWPVKGVVTTK